MMPTIFNIQRYSLHDGGGIRSIVFFKGCPFTCPWCSNPEGLDIKPQEFYKESLCINCSKKINGRCNTKPENCPTGAKEISGKQMDIESIVEEVKKDKVFYETSGGGVTLSGGECLLQQNSAIALLKRLKEEDINTAIETTMSIKLIDIESLVKYTDTFLIDLKIMDEKKAKDICNININLVKDNIIALKKLKANIIIRIPLIPTFTYLNDNIDAIITFMLDIGLDTAHLLPFHQLGESKYKSIDKDYSLHDLRTLDDKEIENIRQMFEKRKIKTVIGGN